MTTLRPPNSVTSSWCVPQVHHLLLVCPPNLVTSSWCSPIPASPKLVPVPNWEIQLVNTTQHGETRMMSPQFQGATTGLFLGGKHVRDERCHHPQFGGTTVTPLTVVFLLRGVSHRVHQQFGTEEADATQDLHGLAQKAHVENRLGQLDVTKVAWALCHVTWRGGHPIILGGPGIWRHPPPGFCESRWVLAVGPTRSVARSWS